MGADSGMSSSMSRGSVMSSSSVPPLPQCIPLEPISLGTQKYTRSGELRRALGFPLGSASEDLPFRASSFKPPPVATEELKQLKESIFNSSMKAKERAKMLHESIYKIDKYREATGLKKKQQTNLLLNEKPGGSSLLKMAGQPPRNFLDQSAQRLEDKAKCAGMNKRFRSSTMELKVDSKAGSLTKDQMSNEKETNITKPVSGVPVPEERILRLSAVRDGWDRNMMKRKRSVGTLASRSTDNDRKRTMHSKLSTDSKLASGDTSALSSCTVMKGKISRAPRTGSVMAVNSSSDAQASSEACEGLEQPTSKVISLGLMQNHRRASNSSHMLGQWVGQRQQKSSRSRRTNVVSPVSNHDEGQISSLNFSPPAAGAKNSLSGNSGYLDSVDVHNTSKGKIKVEIMPSPDLLSEVEDTRALELRTEEKGTDCSDVALNGKGKVRAFVFPTKRNKNALSEKVVDGVLRQGRTVRGLSVSRPGLSQSEAKLENMSMSKRIQSTRPGSDKIRSKLGRPPSRKMSDGRAFTHDPEYDDDHEELLAAATSACKASYLACTGRFWKKMEPIFGSVSSQNASYLKQQLSLAEELEDGFSLIVGAEYILGAFTPKERGDIFSGNKGVDSNQVVNKDEALCGGLTRGRRLDKFSSLYERVLSALIEEDESEGIHTATEGVSMSIQCASDDSHCGSCNYADAETRDRGRLDSEAESIVDFQIQKRCSGDRFSCNKSVTSSTTRNTSMSDSLYSSGRWLGDDGLSHSDAEFVGGSWQNDLGGPQPADIIASGTFPDWQYQTMCVDDRLVLELQSIGLCLDAVPDLAEGEAIDRDISQLKEGLCEQIRKKKGNLVKIDHAIQDDGEREKQYIEQVAMEQLIQMAYKRRMACRRNNASKTVMRKVSKQVAMGFIERTLVRCKNFELTGRSCFSEPALQNVMFASAQGNDVGTKIATNDHIVYGASNCCTDAAKADSTSFSLLDSCIDDLGRSSMVSQQAASHPCEHGFPKHESVSHKGKKRELLLDDVGGTSSRGTTAFDNSLMGGAKGKRSERDGDYTRGALLPNPASVNQSVESFRSEQKPKTKPKQNSNSTSQQWQSTEHNKRGREMGLSSSGNARENVFVEAVEHIDFDSMEQLGISDDLNAPDDLTTWLTGLQEIDSIGLEIPMDDLSMVM